MIWVSGIIGAMVGFALAMKHWISAILFIAAAAVFLFGIGYAVSRTQDFSAPWIVLVIVGMAALPFGVGCLLGGGIGWLIRRTES